MAPTVVLTPTIHLRHKATLQELTEEWQSLQVPFAPQSYRGAAEKHQSTSCVKQKKGGWRLTRPGLATKISAVEAVWYRSLAIGVGQKISKLSTYCDGFRHVDVWWCNEDHTISKYYIRDFQGTSGIARVVTGIEISLPLDDTPTGVVFGPRWAMGTARGWGKRLQLDRTWCDGTLQLVVDACDWECVPRMRMEELETLGWLKGKSTIFYNKPCCCFP